MRRILLLVTVAALAAVMTVVLATPALADRSDSGNRQSATQICSSAGDIELGDNTRIENASSNGGCHHGKHHRKHHRHRHH